MYDINQRSTNGKKKGNSMSKRNNRSVSNQKMRKQANRKKVQNAKRDCRRYYICNRISNRYQGEMIKLDCLCGFQSIVNKIAF